MGNGPSVVLASGSASRCKLLKNAGVAVTVDVPSIDEESVKASLAAEGASAPQVAETLAELKAVRVSRRQPGALVIGADQMLACEGEWFDKPTDLAAARKHLEVLSGKTHQLHCVVCVVRDGERLWHHIDRATLTMRPLSSAFIADYLERAGDEVCQSVGAYQLEGLGAQLFSHVTGDYFTILGLPLLPLLDFLRQHRVVSA